ncbi:hypothetical protein G3I76_49650, partial [Streptomyces sp. SID11233]|nr:hypothetical protein [Streptomyces sp. SID11233]
GRTSATGGHRLDLIALVSAVPPPGTPGPGGPAGAREPAGTRGTAADAGNDADTAADPGRPAGTAADEVTSGAGTGEPGALAAPPWPLPPEQDALLSPEHVEI